MIVSEIYWSWEGNEPLPLPLALPPMSANGVSREEWDECEAALHSRGLRTRQNFRLWARDGHPDRGGDLATFQKMSFCADTVFDTPRPRDGRGPLGRRNPSDVESAIATLALQILGAVRTRESAIGVRTRVGGKIGGQGKGHRSWSMIFRGIRTTGMPIEIVDEVDITVRKGEVAGIASYGMPFGFRLGLGGLVNVHDESVHVLGSLGKRFGPLQVDAIGARRTSDRKSVGWFLSTRVELGRLNKKGGSLLPGLGPQWRWPWANNEKEEEEKGDSAAAENIKTKVEQPGTSDVVASDKNDDCVYDDSKLENSSFLGSETTTPPAGIDT